MKGALLVAGTTSDAGKSVLTAGICRWLARNGVRVAPFKAQNMSLNSVVTVDGAEIGRAQAMQAAACGIEPEAAMNPVLLKPGSDTHSQVVVLGQPIAEVGALDYRDLKPQLEDVVASSLADLRARFDVVICEGAGSPAEINLRDRDIANMGLARAAGLPVIVVGDIDRGGVFAAMFGTLAVLERRGPAADRRLRRSTSSAATGGCSIRAWPCSTELTGRPTLGVLPWRGDLWLDAEDSLDLDSRPRAVIAAAGRRHPAGRGGPAAPAVQRHRRRPAGRRARRRRPAGHRAGASSTDADLVIAARHPGHGARPGLAALRPGWRRRRRPGRRGRPDPRHLRRLPDAGRARSTTTSRAAPGAVDGLGLLPAAVRFASSQDAGPPERAGAGRRRRGLRDPPRRGRASTGGEPFLDGCAVGSVWGTTWHGIFENDEFRRAFLAELADATGRRFVGGPGRRFAAVRERRFDVLGDLVAEHLDTDRLTQTDRGRRCRPGCRS